jgi:hypothetical protein
VGGNDDGAIGVSGKFVAEFRELKHPFWLVELRVDHLREVVDDHHVRLVEFRVEFHNPLKLLIQNLDGHVLTKKVVTSQHLDSSVSLTIPYDVSEEALVLGGVILQDQQQSLPQPRDWVPQKLGSRHRHRHGEVRQERRLPISPPRCEGDKITPMQKALDEGLLWRKLLPQEVLRRNCFEQLRFAHHSVGRGHETTAMGPKCADPIEPVDVPRLPPMSTATRTRAVANTIAGDLLCCIL